MNITINDITKLRFGTRAAWLVTLLLLIMAYRQVKDGMVFVLSKGYEFIIQQNAIKP